MTRDIVAGLLVLELQQDAEVLALLKRRLKTRGIKWVSSIARQADVPAGAQILPNKSGSAPGLYLRSNINPAVISPHLFLLPGPPRELQPMFRDSVMSILRSIVPSRPIERRIYNIACLDESIVDEPFTAKGLTIHSVGHVSSHPPGVLY